MDARSEQLARHLAGVIGARSVDGLMRLSGGASRETWRFSADGRPLVVQRQRPGDGGDMEREATVLRAAGAAGAPVAEVIASGIDADGVGFIVSEAVEGETIARKILREIGDEERSALTRDLGRALARTHAVDPSTVPDLPADDQLEQYRLVLDELGEPHPTFELAFRWLHDHRPPPPARTVLVHGDFRLGNLVVDHHRLRAVLDWELAHVGDPMEDLGWLCVRAWRFGADHPVAGVGSYPELFAAYEASGGDPVDPEVVRWWEVFGTLRWGVICIMQADTHRSGRYRSHELAAIGRRVCENEYDLFLALDGRWGHDRGRVDR